VYLHMELRRPHLEYLEDAPHVGDGRHGVTAHYYVQGAHGVEGESVGLSKALAPPMPSVLARLARKGRHDT
jgi:hypothetical protein